MNLSVIGFGNTWSAAADAVVVVNTCSTVPAASVPLEAVEDTISHQLIFHPPLAAVVTILKVCCPAGSVTVEEKVCQVWKEPVLGTVIVASTVPSDLRSWNVAPEKADAT